MSLLVGLGGMMMNDGFVVCCFFFLFPFFAFLTLCGVEVDIEVNQNQPFVCTYVSTSIINWHQCYQPFSLSDKILRPHTRLCA